MKSKYEPCLLKFYEKAGEHFQLLAHRLRAGLDDKHLVDAVRNGSVELGMNCRV